MSKSFNNYHAKFSFFYTNPISFLHLLNKIIITYDVYLKGWDNMCFYILPSSTKLTIIDNKIKY